MSFLKTLFVFWFNGRGAHLTVDILGATAIFAVGRVRFVTPVTAKVFRSFLAPRGGKMSIYTVCMLGAGCILNSAVLP